MTDQHPITPPPELVQQWITEGRYQNYCSTTEYAITQATRWGADQELEACCEWLENQPQWMEDLRAARRPKPPSLKEQALAILDDAHRGDLGDNEMAIIRRALEQLND